MQPTNCLNCGNELNGPFCSQCGQKETHRYSLGHVFHEMVHVFTHADKGIFSFAWNIIKKPGTIALDLVEGRRKRYFNLFQYLLLIVGLVTFLIIKFNLIETTLNTVNNVTQTTFSERQAFVQKQTSIILQKYNNVLQLLLIPIYTFFSWLFMARKKYNYAERLVLHAASSAQTNTLAIVTTLLMLFASGTTSLLIIGILSFAIMIGSFTMSYMQFFKFGLLKSLGYSFLIFFCSYIVQSFAIGTIFTIYALIIYPK